MFFVFIDIILAKTPKNILSMKFSNTGEGFRMKEVMKH